MTARITLYRDFKRQIIEEVRCMYSNRADKLMMRRRFPYEFKTVEEYAPGKKTSSGLESHLKRLVQVDGNLRQLYYYPHRNKDGLIYREEKIMHKTIEKYRSRPDKLVYRSITFDPDKNQENKDVTFRELHSKKEVVIKKMTQKYELDKTRSPEVQHSKVVINYDKKVLIEYFHYSENSVKQAVLEQSLDTLRTTEANEKETEKSGEEQRKQALTKIIKDCMNDIQSQEYTAGKEMVEVITGEIFEKSIFDKARERAKREKKQQEEEGNKDEEVDYLAPVFAKLQLEKEFRDYKKGTPLTLEQAKRVQNEAFQMHKERIKARAKIIQDRLDAEVKKIQDRFVSPADFMALGIDGDHDEPGYDDARQEGRVPERLQRDQSQDQRTREASICDRFSRNVPTSSTSTRSRSSRRSRRRWRWTRASMC